MPRVFRRSRLARGSCTGRECQGQPRPPVRILVNVMSARSVSWDNGPAIRGTVFRHLITADDTGGRFSAQSAVLAPRKLVIPHSHEREDEFTFVYRGRIGGLVGKRRQRSTRVDSCSSLAASCMPCGTPRMSRSLSSSSSVQPGLTTSSRKWALSPKQSHGPGRRSRSGTGSGPTLNSSVDCRSVTTSTCRPGNPNAVGTSPWRGPSARGAMRSSCRDPNLASEHLTPHSREVSDGRDDPVCFGRAGTDGCPVHR